MYSYLMTAQTFSFKRLIILQTYYIMSDTWFCEKQSSDDFQQKSVGNKPKKELPRVKKDKIYKINEQRKTAKIQRHPNN